jgi:hypothetical protein
MNSILSKSYTSARNYLGDTILGDTGFFFHFSAYVIVNVILIAVNLLFTPQVIWFFWPLLGWGIGILAHGLAVHFSQEETVRRRARTRDARVAAKRAS